MTSGILFSLVPHSVLNYDKVAIHSKHFIYKLLGGEEEASVTSSIVVMSKNKSY